MWTVYLMNAITNNDYLVTFDDYNDAYAYAAKQKNSEYTTYCVVILYNSNNPLDHIEF